MGIGESGNDGKGAEGSGREWRGCPFFFFFCPPSALARDVKRKKKIERKKKSARCNLNQHGIRRNFRQYIAHRSYNRMHARAKETTPQWHSKKKCGAALFRIPSLSRPQLTASPQNAPRREPSRCWGAPRSRSARRRSGPRARRARPRPRPGTSAPSPAHTSSSRKTVCGHVFLKAVAHGRAPAED